MINLSRYSTFKNVLSECYIAKKTNEKLDKFGNKIPEYSKANSVPYKWNIQNVSQSSETYNFGEKALEMKVAMLVGNERDKFINEFKPYDLAYLDGATPNGEKVFGSNANYRVYAVKPQNVALKIYFEKL